MIAPKLLLFGFFLDFSFENSSFAVSRIESFLLRGSSALFRQPFRSFPSHSILFDFVFNVFNRTDYEGRAGNKCATGRKAAYNS